MSIIRYRAAIWGNKEYSCINAVYYRMCRYYHGVWTFTPNAAVQGYMGLWVPWQHQRVQIYRHYCRLVNMSNVHVLETVFKWCNEQNVIPETGRYEGLAVVQRFCPVYVMKVLKMRNMYCWNAQCITTPVPLCDIACMTLYLFLVKTWNS